MTETIPIREVSPSPQILARSRPGGASRGFGAVVAVGSFALVSGLCAWLGYYTTFNSLAGWDDEGELLLTVKTFAHHGGLYTHLYSSFGPFYYEAFSTVFSWVPVTLDSGRVTTLVVTVLTSLGFGIATRMFTRNVLAGVVTQAGAFVLLILSLVDESMHPMMLVWLLFAVALIALALIARGKRSVGCTLLGATVAALVLTVVNVGVFATIALLYTGLALAPTVRHMRLLRATAAALFVGTPFLLILVASGHVSQSWALKYCFVVALAAAGVVVVTLDRTHEGLVQARDLYRFLGGAVVMGVLISGIAILSGTRPLDLVRGLFIDPARFSNAFTIPLTFPGWAVGWSVVGFVGAVLYRRYRRRSSPPGLIDACAHVAVGTLILYCALQQTQLAFTNTFEVALPLLFFAALPPVGANNSERIARVALVSLAVLEGLIAYPVAGAQVRWSSLLLVPAGVLCLHDAVRPLLLSPSEMASRAWHLATGLLASAVLLAGIGWFSSVFFDDQSIMANWYYAAVPLRLPGSDMIRLPAFQERTLESTARTIRMHCSLFVTLPAMNSFYFWTNEGTPTNWTNTWFFTSNTAQQRSLLASINAHRSQFCVVQNLTWVSFWYQGHALPQLPLARLVEKFMRESGPPTIIDGYRVFVPRAVTQ